MRDRKGLIMGKRKLKKSWASLFVVLICIACAIAGLSYYNRLRFSPKRDASQYSSEDLYASVSEDSHIKTSMESGERYYNNEMIIYTKGHMEKVIDQVQRLYNCKLVGKNVFDQSFLIRFPDGISFDQLSKRLNKVKNFEYVYNVSKNYAITIDDESLPYWQHGSWKHRYGGSNWSMKAINAPYGWQYQSLMKSVNVGILDTGFDSDAEDLKGKLTVLGENSEDTDHGSHVAGIIGANSTNKEGVAGLAPKVSMYGVCEEKHTSIYSIMTNLHILNEQGCKIINLSIGSDELSFAATEGNTNAKNAIRRMSKLLAYSISKFKHPSLLVASSGNANAYKYIQVDDAFYGYKKLVKKDGKKGFYDDRGEWNRYNTKIYGDQLKGDCDAYWNIFNYIDDSRLSSKIMVVGSVSLHKKHYKVSDYSVGGTRVNVLAPGDHVYSVLPSSNSDYGYLSGTSQAAAHVTGLAALLLSMNHSLSITQLLDGIINTADVATNDLTMINAKSAIHQILKDHPIYTTLSGRILDENKKPMKNVTVSTSAEGKTISTYTTKDDGKYTLKARIGETTLKATCSLYATYTKKYTINTKNQKIKDIVLDKEKWKEEYVNFIKVHPGTSYALWKVDSNNTPELMVFGPSSNYFVTYKNKHLYQMDMGPQLSNKGYSEKGNLVYASYTKDKTTYDCYYKIGTSGMNTVHIGQITGNSYIWDVSGVDSKTYQKNKAMMDNRLHASTTKEYNSSSIEKAIMDY